MPTRGSYSVALPPLVTFLVFDTWQGLGTSLLQGRMLLGRLHERLEEPRLLQWEAASPVCEKKSLKEAHWTHGGRTKEIHVCHSTYRLCLLMAEQQNALARWIYVAAPPVTVAWVSKRRTSWGLRRRCVSELVQTNLSTLPCTSGSCVSLNNRI